MPSVARGFAPITIDPKLAWLAADAPESTLPETVLGEQRPAVPKSGFSGGCDCTLSRKTLL
jgi:hypothetical protein